MGLSEQVVAHANFWVAVVLLMLGLYAMITKNNLVKKLIGMSIFQTAIILFYVSAGAKEGADIPILPEHGHEEHGDTEHADEPGNTHASEDHEEPDPHSAPARDHEPAHEPDPELTKDDWVDGYANPLPHVLMLTAIVVGVSTLGVALALVQVIYRNFGSIEEDEILRQLEEQEDV